jgi:hypothetical protein
MAATANGRVLAWSLDDAAAGRTREPGAPATARHPPPRRGQAAGRVRILEPR